MGSAPAGTHAAVSGVIDRAVLHITTNMAGSVAIEPLTLYRFPDDVQRWCHN